MSRCYVRGIGIALVGLGIGLAPAQSHAEDDGVVEEVLGILRERGILGEGEYARLSTRYAESKRERSWLDRFHFSGDFRARHESFWYDRDETGVERDNRYRGRFRFRLGMEAEVNDWTQVHLRLASGQDDSRSTNQSFGSGVDFDPDQIFIDRAYVALAAPFVAKERGSAQLQIGKMGNLFTWKVGKDVMLWDGDINMDGAGVKLGLTPAENLELWLHSGYFVVDEESRAADPHLFAAQLGAELGLAEHVAMGARGTYYQFRSLNEDFLCRGFDGDNCDGSSGATPAGGNLLEPVSGFSGLTGNADGDGGIDVVEGAVYLTWSRSEYFPVTVYGAYAQNLDARALNFGGGLVTDEEDTAWGAGIEIGDKKKLVMLGAGYWELEANAFPSQFVDSDLFDGVTNRKGWAIYGSRQLFPNTDLNLTFFVGDEIEDDLTAFDESLSDAERMRLQTDLVFKF